jgi:hypothetical protein
MPPRLLVMQVRGRCALMLACMALWAGALMPASVFCKGTQSLASRYMLGMNEGVQAEVNFYTLVRPKRCTPVTTRRH